MTKHPHLLEILENATRDHCVRTVACVDWYLNCEFNSLVGEHAEEILFPDRCPLAFAKNCGAECTSKLTTAFKDAETMNFQS